MRSVASILCVTALALPAFAQAEKPEVQLTKKITLSFENTSLAIVLDAIQRTAEVNIVVDPAVDPWATNVTGTASNESIATFLTGIQEQAGLERKVWGGAVLLYETDPGEEPKAPKGEGSKALAKAVTVNFVRTPLADVMTRMKTRYKVEYRISSKVRGHLNSSGKSVSLQAWRMPIWQVLSHAARSCAVTWKLDKKGVVEFGSSKEGPNVTADQLSDVDFKESIEKQGPKIDIDKLCRRLQNPSTRASAAIELTRQGKPVAPKVAALLPEADPATCEAALNVLAEIGDPTEYAAVLKVFEDSENRSIELRTVAGNTIAAMKPPEAIPALIDALDDNWFRIAETARKALVAIGTPAVKPLGRGYATAARKEKGKDGLVYRSLLAFGEIGDKTSKAILLAAMKTTKGPRAVPIRHHAAIGLGLTGDPKVVQPLIQSLRRERNFRVAKYITRSLTWITDQDLGPQAERWQTWWNQEGKAKFVSPKSADDLLDQVGGGVKLDVDEEGFAKLRTTDAEIQRQIERLGDPKTRKDAEVTLEAIGEKAVGALQKAADDPKVGAAASRVLAKIQGG